MDTRGSKRYRSSTEADKPLCKQHVAATRTLLNDPDLPADVRAHKLKAYRLYVDFLGRPSTRAFHQTFIDKQMHDYGAVLAPFFGESAPLSMDVSSPSVDPVQHPEQESTQDIIARQAVEIEKLQAQLQAMRLAPAAESPPLQSPPLQPPPLQSRIPSGDELARSSWQVCRPSAVRRSESDRRGMRRGTKER